MTKNTDFLLHIEKTLPAKTKTFDENGKDITPKVNFLWLWTLEKQNTWIKMKKTILFLFCLLCWEKLPLPDIMLL